MPTTLKPRAPFKTDTNPEFEPTGPYDPGNINEGSAGSDRGTMVLADSNGLVGRHGSSLPASGSLGPVSLAAPAPITVTTGTSPFAIHIDWDASVASAPTAFSSAVIAAAQYLERQFTNAITVNISVGYGEVGGTSLGGGALGASQSYLQYVSYASLVAALRAHNQDATDASVLASLPSASPVGGFTWVTSAQSKALGLSAANGPSTDGYVGYSSTYGFTYDNTAGVAAGTFDFNGTALHELTEVLGRMMFTGGAIGPFTPSYTLLDMLHYAAPGVRDLSASTPGYFSVNGGVTNLANFNAVSGGDSGDWGAGVGNDALNAFSNSSVVNVFSSADLTVMDAIGYDWVGASPPVVAPPPPPPPPLPPPPPPVVAAPTGVSVSPLTASLQATQGKGGMVANKTLAAITQVGGQTGDTFAYSLGGDGAGWFVLTSVGSVGTLSTGSLSLAGAASGKLYALTVTATDTTAVKSSGASTLDVVVGSIGGDSVSLATLVGSGMTAAPTFIYALSGNDRINGTGMTGKLWIDGGAGADTMIGGSGVNDYLYGSTNDSTASAMDIINNFRAETDMIDLTGIGATSLTFAGSLSGTTLAARSIGFKVNGGNTFVYVNTSSSQESLTPSILMPGPNMKIDLVGSIALTRGNILHN